MKQVFVRFVLPLLGLLVFNTAGVMGHASMSAAHGSHGTTQSSQSLSCASLCMNLPVNRGFDDEQQFRDDDEDNFSHSTYADLLEPVSDSAVHEGRAHLVSKFDPPPGPPGYILNGVFRV